MGCELFTWDVQCDIPHWLGLVIEAGIATVLGALFFHYEKKRSRKQHRIFNNRHNHAYYTIRDNIEGILIEINLIEEINERYSHRPVRELEIEYMASLNRLDENKENLDNICNTSRDVLEPRDESRITREIAFLNTFLECARNNTEYTEVLGLVKVTANNMLKDLPVSDDDGINAE